WTRRTHPPPWTDTTLLPIPRLSPIFGYFTDKVLPKGYIKEPFAIEEGYIRIPTRPGLGIELDEDALADKIEHEWRNRESYDPDDGSVVDW
ncbi:MAG: hypothetical protein GY906_04165, partial [bacterium]|nr:hypothetical protein [bacterium]